MAEVAHHFWLPQLARSANKDECQRGHSPLASATPLLPLAFAPGLYSPIHSETNELPLLNRPPIQKEFSQQDHRAFAGTLAQQIFLATDRKCSPVTSCDLATGETPLSKVPAPHPAERSGLPAGMKRTTPGIDAVRHRAGNPPGQAELKGRQNSQTSNRPAVLDESSKKQEARPSDPPLLIVNHSRASPCGSPALVVPIWRWLEPLPSNRTHLYLLAGEHAMLKPLSLVRIPLHCWDLTRVAIFRLPDAAAAFRCGDGDGDGDEDEDEGWLLRWRWR